MCIVTVVESEGSRDLGIWAGRKKKKKGKKAPEAEVGGEYETTGVVAGTDREGG